MINSTTFQCGCEQATGLFRRQARRWSASSTLGTTRTMVALRLPEQGGTMVRPRRGTPTNPPGASAPRLFPVRDHFGGAGGSGLLEGQPRPKPKQVQPRRQKLPGALPAQPAPRPRPSVKPIPARPVRTPPLRTEERNGYKFQLDEEDKPRRIDVPRLGTEARTRRSRSAQRNAGKPDRLSTDDGGHYIAHRFNGPNDAFNHFAQDRSSNRGRYRMVEDEWAHAQAQGKDVSLAMTIVYPKGSRRPDFIHIWFNLGGETKYEKIDNRPGMTPVRSKRRKRK